ncbi:peptide/nickel transport system permease protein [Rhizobium sp. PP-F2F-G38]|uniref:ABC transporter permease n=1 Tax=Ferranicluibacter rubi TaxID=2715133 RepID=UPI000D9F1FDD|nr:ABC transporter permease [Ferranicluibacter rubi]PYE94899.1 peptide/nickel transport system permease protein [Rhizobium sp. PP-F2F-G38]TCL92306.1 peptide/nickel transport system permease protein [Rhizobium sp. PP-WC-2G-219]TCP82091.1 peptide/nickel transport system permease protein [Rhizobium sp. PP-CC-2G-626]TCQ05282.1 peptide/nickel transport system permease protein [Rhizobium sp. PP-F2F-G36]
MKRRLSRPFLTLPVLFGLIVLALLVFCVIFADLLYPGNPWRMVARPNLPPLSPGFPAGTDMLGRDLAAGLVHGSRATLVVAFSVVAFAVGLGSAIGLAAGYLGAAIDEGLMRFTEFFQTIPGFLLTIMIVAIFSPTRWTVILAIALMAWPPIVRVVRAEVLSLRRLDWVRAARVSGLSHIRIALLHVLPNVLPQIVVQSSLLLASAIMIESGISFLGLGSRDAVSWGFLLGSGRTAFSVNWWLSTLPGLAIFLTVLAFNLVGDGLERWLDPKRSRRAGP